MMSFSFIPNAGHPFQNLNIIDLAEVTVLVHVSVWRGKEVRLRLIAVGLHDHYGQGEFYVTRSCAFNAVSPYRQISCYKPGKYSIL